MNQLIPQHVVEQKLSESEALADQRLMGWPVRRVCAWCKLEMGLADHCADEPDQVTHGLCADCAKSFFDLDTVRAQSSQAPEPASSNHIDAENTLASNPARRASFFQTPGMLGALLAVNHPEWRLEA